MVKLYTNIILTKHYFCRVKHKKKKNVAKAGSQNKNNLAHIINFIVGNPPLIMRELLSTNYTWVNWPGNPLSHVMVIKHFDKSRGLSL